MKASLDDNLVPSSQVSSSPPLLALDLAAGPFVVFDLTEAELVVSFLDLTFVAEVWTSVFGSKRSLSIVDVADVHVDGEQIAARIDSAVA